MLSMHEYWWHTYWVAICDTLATMFVCWCIMTFLYSGNIRGVRPYLTGDAPCSACPQDLPHCTNNLCCELPYSGKLSREKLSQIGEKYDFHWENLRRLLAFTMPKDTTPPNFVEKTFANSHKPRKFSPSKVSHYTVHAQCAQLMCFWFHLSPFLTPIIILIYHSCHWKPSTNCWSTNHWKPATNHRWR